MKIFFNNRSGVEGKYIELENFVCEKIRNLSPNRFVYFCNKDIYDFILFEF